MILDKLNIEKNGKNYNQTTIRKEVFLCCDYCGKNFQRIKKSRIRLNKIIDKDSCGEKSCKNKKKEDVNFKKYNVNNYFQSDDFLKKAKKTNIEKYGTETYFSSDDFQKKRSKKLIKNYGVDSPLKNEEIKNKQKQTCIERYATDNFSKTKEFIEKYKKTSNQNYECDFPIKSKKIKEKNKIKYGCEYTIQSEQSKLKIKKSYIEHYGVDHPSKSEEVKEKTKKTNLKKYGTCHASSNPEVKEKIKKTTFERHGHECTFKCPKIIEKIKQTNLERYGQPKFKFGKTQESIKIWLNEYGLNFESDYEILEGKELDLYDKDKKIAIEYCGIYWHNEDSPEPRLSKYHYNKYKGCKDKGIQLLTIFDDEWKNRQNIIKSVILSKLGLFSKRTYARKCTTKQIDKKIFSDFCEAYHVQGKNSLSSICFGLFFENELVGVMDLGRHHRKKEKDTMVLTRLCFKEGMQIVGGSSKLFKTCVDWCKNNNIYNIISWSDNRWSDGTIYRNLGFSFEEELRPDYCYVNIKNPKKRISKQSQKKSNSNCPENMTELEWAKSRGLSRIWDCGKTRWNYNI